MTEIINFDNSSKLKFSAFLVIDVFAVPVTCSSPISFDSVDTKELQTLCQTVLKEFDFVLFHSCPEENSSAKLGEEKMAHLEDEMVFKIVVLITIVVHKLQYQGKWQVVKWWYSYFMVQCLWLYTEFVLLISYI